MKAKNIGQFELYKKLQEAVKSGRYMVTITTYDDKKRRLDHYTVTNHFPREDILPSLEACAANMQDDILAAK